MQIGIGLPVTAPDVLLDWAREIDAGPFDTITVSDRLVYDNAEPLVTLAAVAGATSRVGLRTHVLLPALRESALFVKQIATLDRLSGGRLSLGLGLGDREDDYDAVGVPIAQRGRRMDLQLERLREAWQGRPFRGAAEDIGVIGPRPFSAEGPELLFGGYSDAAVRRAARSGSGFLSATPPEHTGWMFQDVRKAWKEAGREDEPKLVAQANTAVGSEDMTNAAKSRIADYYSFLDPTEAPFTGAMMAEGSLTTPEDIRRAAESCRDSGADELMFTCWDPDIGQLGRIAEALS